MIVTSMCLGTPSEVPDALSRQFFGQKVLVDVVEKGLGFTDVLSRPAEFCFLPAYRGPSAARRGLMGVQVQLAHVRRNGKTPKQFHKALQVFHKIVKDTVSNSLGYGQKCQVMCIIELDGEIETFPGSGINSRFLMSNVE